MNIGLDIHGVIDRDPLRFIKIAHEIKRNGGKVYIITGHPIDDRVFAELIACGFEKDCYDEIVSIQDELEKRGYPVLYLDKHGRNHYDDLAWNSFKGRFCKEHSIDLHIDDTREYIKHFETPIALYRDGEMTFYRQGSVTIQKNIFASALGA